MDIFGALSGIAGLGSAASSLFGGGYDSHDNHRGREAREWDSTKVQRLVADAKAAGVSPLVALGSPVSQGFALPVDQGSSSLVGSNVGAALSNLSSVGAQLYQDDTDVAERGKDRALQERIRRDSNANVTRQVYDNEAQLSEQKRVNDAQIRQLDSETMLNAARSRSLLSAVDASSKGATTGSFDLPFGGNWKKYGGVDEQTIENEYGDVAGNVYGLYKLWADSGFNMRDQWNKMMGAK